MGAVGQKKFPLLLPVVVSRHLSFWCNMFSTITFWRVEVVSPIYFPSSMANSYSEDTDDVVQL